MTTRRLGKTPRKPGKRHLKKWHDSLKEAHNLEIKKYSSLESFYQGDVIQHEYFGKGRVQACYGNKIQVIFEDRMRLLMQKTVF